MTQTWTITYNDKRCNNCGRFWSVESEKCNYSMCPVCAFDNRYNERDRRLGLEKTISALKGQITKLKKK